MVVLPVSVLTCVALHHPGFELDDRVGIVTAVLSLAVHVDGLLTQIQATQDAERAHLPHTEALHLKGQASDRHKGRRKKSPVDGIWRTKRGWEYRHRADSLIGIEGVASPGTDGLIAFVTPTDGSRFTIETCLKRTENESGLDKNTARFPNKTSSQEHIHPSHRLYAQHKRNAS